MVYKYEVKFSFTRKGKFATKAKLLAWMRYMLRGAARIKIEHFKVEEVEIE